ncbi:MAG: sigma-Y antisigma factor component [Clostridia bacterium]
MNLTVHPNEIPLFYWILLAIIMFSQSTWLFLDARKYGHKKWLWGLVGLIQFPMPLLVYLLFVKKIGKSKNHKR